jgi:hypothetical protein
VANGPNSCQMRSANNSETLALDRISLVGRVNVTGVTGIAAASKV